jgi:DNA invertase Pin-like site-specific DNA recombinase
MNKKQEVLTGIYRKMNRKRLEQPPQRVALTKNCIIYTRVSDPHQAKKFSLEFQGDQCRDYAQKQGYHIVEHFGGKSESASREERQEFERMLKYVRQRRGNVSYIIVYNLDRFGRRGNTDGQLIEELRQRNIFVESVTQPIDNHSISGDFHRDMLMAAAKYEIKVKNRRCNDGKNTAVSKGTILVKPPFGYDYYWKNDKRIIEPEPKSAAIVKKVFHWKGNEQLTNREILDKLEAMGYKWRNARLLSLLRNPTYCGFVVWKPAGGVVPGNHPKLVTEDVWIRANQQKPVKDTCGRYDIDEERLPLKKFYKCSCCGSSLTGFKNEKKGLYYYRCQHNGHVSENADKLGNRFRALLEQVQIPEQWQPLFKEQLMQVLEALNRQQQENHSVLKSRLKELQHKQDRMEERYVVEGEITKEQFEKFNSRLCEEM